VSHQPGSPWAPPPAPPSFTYGPGWGADHVPPPPPRRRSPWKRALLVIGIVAVVVGAAVAVIAVVDPFGSDYPSEWDARAAGFTSFVEKTTGHTYDHPVPVRFLTDADFVELVSSDPGELSEDDKQSYADSEAQGRALGLFSGSTDLFAEQDTLSTEGILAYYSPDDHEVVVRLPKGAEPDDIATGDDLPIDVQVTLVHELTHVLQDQVYDLAKIQNDAVTPEEYSAVLGLIEGHAEWVAQQYITDELTTEQQDEYYSEQDTESGSYEEATSDVTPVLSAAQSAPYALGPPFVAAVADSGRSAIDDAFADPPTTERELMIPSVYLDHVEAPDIDELTTPDGADEFDSGTLGATTVYFMLSLGLDAPTALQAIDGAAADRYVAYKRDDTICVDITVAASDDDAATLLDKGFSAWAGERPAEANATSTRDGTTFELHACDPGTESDQSVPGEDAIDQIFARAGDLGYLIQEAGYSLPEAECLTNGLYYEFTVEDINNGTPEVSDAIDALYDSCS
jgi:hypothetical protein